MDEPNSEKDLPLMANTDNILVQHYMFDLLCDFDEKIFVGSVILHLEPTKHGSCDRCDIDCCNADASVKCHENDTLLEQNNFNYQPSPNKFVCILDCCDIKVCDVVELDISSQHFHQNQFVANKEIFPIKTGLKFTVDKWSLKIWKPGLLCYCTFPRFIKISYSTKPEGPSLIWVWDQDGRPAVFTYGAWVNNRSLFPCQEPPCAMASWEASIAVAFPAVVLMSGDCCPLRFHHDGIATFYYYTKMSLPLSTLALAVGFWDVQSSFKCKPLDFRTDIRICASPSLLPSVVEEFADYIFCSVKTAEEIFGDYPFPRIDFLVVPRGFCSLGMASPNIIFLSQSLVSGDGSMSSRIAHEIAHAWFGLLIGALDWREEWLSEGFATFAEDIIHARTLGLSTVEVNEFFEMRCYARSKTLMSEVENTVEEDLLILRPNSGEPVIQNIENVEAIVLKNGRNEEKCFMQVHYIKGFFLLKFLSSVVGLPSFLQFLKAYIVKYKGRLLSSVEMLEFFVSTFPEKCGESVTVDNIVSEWLHTSKVPEVISSCATSPSNSIFRIARQEATQWKRLNTTCLLKKNSKRRKHSTDQFKQLSTDSILLLLDILLEEDTLSVQVLRLINDMYNLEKKNAEIRHKWGELIVKHRYYAGYECLEKFLKDDLAMGIYLYGELILNGTKSQKVFAENCYYNIKREMEPNSITVIQNMLEQYNKS